VVAHPCTNGQAEGANILILQGLKPLILTQEGKDVLARLSTRARKWAAKVPSVLWSPQTMPNRSTNFRPFFHGAWSRGRVTHRTVVRIPQGPSLSTGQGRASMTRHHRLARRIKGHHHHKVSRVPTDTLTVPRTKGPSPGFPGRRLSFTMSGDQER
jgi:hypothetical protein